MHAMLEARQEDCKAVIVVLWICSIIWEAKSNSNAISLREGYACMDDLGESGWLICNEVEGIVGVGAIPIHRRQGRPFDAKQ